MQIQSPQHSNPYKVNLSSFVSPTYRNKRIASAQLYSAQRANSCKKLDSPSKALQKMRKKSQNNNQQMQQMNKPNQILQQMSLLKQEYTNLKTAYKKLVSQKMKHSQKNSTTPDENQKVKRQIQKATRQNQELKNKVSFLEAEIERIKKQSMKLIQIWQFRMKRLEQNLAQKQKSVNDLRECLIQHNIQPPRLSCKKETVIIDQKLQSCFQKGLHGSLAAISESLIMGKYDSISNMSNFVSISMNSILQESSIFQLRRQKQKQNKQNKPLQVSVDFQQSLNNITSRTKQDENKKADDNFKKFRKQISKKIEVHIDDKHKQLVTNFQPKTPLDRKVNKSTKSSKIKLKKQDDNYENKSSKKRVAK